MPDVALEARQRRLLAEARGMMSVVDTSADVAQLTSDLRRWLSDQRADFLLCEHEDEVSEIRDHVTAVFAALRDEIDALENGFVAATGPHVCVWDERDFCSVCGRDGRS